MEPLIYLHEYMRFLEWFKIKYPDLYDRYFVNILVPRDKKGIKIIRDNLRDDIYNKLVNIRNAYYEQKKGGFYTGNSH